MQRRQLIQAGAVMAFSASLSPAALAQARPRIEIWKDPNCGCCEEWVSHLKQNGFETQVHANGNAAARQRLHVPEKLASCHTGQVAARGRAYAIEGHVPAREIHRLLKERPKASGLVVPGMPIGSPGMDSAIYGERKDAYDVLLIQADGSTSVYQRYHQAST
jgi:hypothetical protein